MNEKGCKPILPSRCSLSIGMKLWSWSNIELARHDYFSAHFLNPKLPNHKQQQLHDRKRRPVQTGLIECTYQTYTSATHTRAEVATQTAAVPWNITATEPLHQYSRFIVVVGMTAAKAVASALINATTASNQFPSWANCARSCLSRKAGEYSVKVQQSFTSRCCRCCCCCSYQ